MLNIKPVKINDDTWEFTWSFDKDRPDKNLWVRAVSSRDAEVQFPIYDMMHLTPCAIKEICHEKVRAYVDGSI